ncbi:MAG: amidohydrolase family protein [Peptococcaceae bacterium]|jgi:cytosine/adenosine deaminase-related metal-dependent hydrolase|nr:amidohydrolase family protein [Peptococcaceae bacterium]
MRQLLKNALVLRDARGAPTAENIMIDDDRIAGFTLADSVPGYAPVDLSGRLVIPGFVQAHVHFCQALLRGAADDMALLDWLRTRVWPLEAAHDEESVYLSALLAGTELLAGGATCACVMESVRYADAAARAIDELGLRAVFGKVMMDHTDTPPELGGLPDSFIETTRQTLDESLRLLKKWHGAAAGRISYAFMPRGVLTTSEDLLLELRKLSDEYGALVHTHACETWPESRLVERRRGQTEIKYLRRLGLANERLLLAHCVCVDDEDIHILSKHRVNVVSCPLANLKLASGIAPLEKLADAGITLSLGSDGPPCNNTLDMFTEMRFASLLQKGALGQPTAMPAPQVFEIATLGGAKALGLDGDIGSLAVGKKADLAALDWQQPQTAPQKPCVAGLVYSGGAHMVTDTMVDGRFVYRHKKHVAVDTAVLRRQAEVALERLTRRFSPG